MSGSTAWTSFRADQFFTRKSDELVTEKATFCEASYQNHFTRSKETIIETIKGLKGVALVLGVGAAHDVPLKELGEIFDQIHLVDADIRYSRIAVAVLSEELQGKFSFEQADLTGCFEEFSHKAEEIAKEAVSYDEFGRRILDMLPLLTKNRFGYQELKVSFVCSSLISSQLFSYPTIYLNRLCRAFYFRNFTAPLTRMGEYTAFISQFILNHIAEIHNLMAPEGHVYFADTFSGRTIEDVKSTLGESRLVLPARKYIEDVTIYDYMRKYFRAISDTNWTWTVPMERSSKTISAKKEDGTSCTISVETETSIEYLVTSFHLALH